VKLAHALFFAFAIAAASHADGQQIKPHMAKANQLIIDWNICVVMAATNYAASRDAAEFIVKVALRECAKEKQAVEESFKQSGVPASARGVDLKVIEEEIVQAASIGIITLRSPVRR